MLYTIIIKEIRMYSRTITDNYSPYSHTEWKEEFDQLTDSKNSSEPINTVNLMKLIIQERLADERHYDYFYNPQKLLTSLMNDIQQLFKSHDAACLVEQDVHTRFYMLKINTIIERIQQENKDLKASDETNKKFQMDIAFLETELSAYSTLIREHDSEFYKRLTSFFNNYAIHSSKYTPVITLTDSNLNWLAQHETKAYQEALTQLRTTTAALSPVFHAVQNESNKLINKLEANRLASEKPSCFFKEKPFDYKRQTLNLKKTNELLQDPTNKTKQDEYQQLINSNAHNDMETKKILLYILGGVVIVSTLLYSLLTTPALTIFGAIMIGIGLGYGGTVATLGAGMGMTTAISKCTRTQARMASLFKEVKQEGAAKREAQTETSLSPYEAIHLVR